MKAWIQTVEEADWAGELAEIRPMVLDAETQQVDNIMAVHSLDAGSMRAHLGLYVQAMRSTNSLPKIEREMIALVVSKANDCHY